MLSFNSYVYTYTLVKHFEMRHFFMKKLFKYKYYLLELYNAFQSLAQWPCHSTYLND